MTSSLRKRFFERRNHLEEVAKKIVRLLAATGGDRAGLGGATGPDIEVVSPDVIAALENVMYDIFDLDMWSVVCKDTSETPEMVLGNNRKSLNACQSWCSYYTRTKI